MDGVRGIAGGTATRPGRGVRSTGGGFRLPAAAERPETAAAEATAAPSAAGLLALQETIPPAERDARARRRGQAMLEALAAIQVDLLAGRVDPARLEALARLTEGEAAADPALAEAVAAITLRARVELARRGR